MVLRECPIFEKLELSAEFNSKLLAPVLKQRAMGHWHFFNGPHIFEGEQEDQSWNSMHVDQPNANLVVGGLPESASFFYPAENLAVDGLHFTSQWNPTVLTPIPNGYIASNRVESLNYQPDSSRPPYDPFLRLAPAGTFSSVTENHVSSSYYDRQICNGTGNSYFDATMGSGRGPHKRKSPGISSAWDRGSTSTHYAAGSSSDIPLSPEPWLDKSYSDRHYMQQMTVTPYYHGAASHRAESSTRNVRSRSAHDLESNLVRSHQTNYCSHGYLTGHDYSHPSTMGQCSGYSTHQWNHARMVPVHARIPISGLSDPSGSNQEGHNFHFGLSGSNGAADTRGYHHNHIPYRDPVVHQSFDLDLPRPIRGARASYSQRPGSSFRASGSLRLGHGASSQESSQMIAQSHFSRHPRLPDRYRSLSNEGNLHNRLPSEGYIVMDRAAYYGSRSAVDPHRDMRLDVDNMTYEELLALGERIGSVSTGLPEDSISKSLTKTVYRSFPKMLEAGNCAICLEDYKDKDDVGTLRKCKHDYHVNCIKKWLSMKNMCPICKASAMPDNTKDP